MKNLKTIMYFVLVLISISSYGQENKKEMRFSINVGITYSNMFGKGIIKDSWIHGYPPDCYTNGSASDKFILGKKIGIGVTKELNKTFSIGLDLNYEEKGCIIPITNLSYSTGSNDSYKLVQKEVDENTNIKLKYLVIPLKLETIFKIFYLQSGIYTGILLDADDYGEIDGVKFERDKDGRYSFFDLGLLVGFGTNISLSEKTFLRIGVNGNWNITGNDGRGMQPKYKHHWYNQSFNLEMKFERKI